MLWTRDFIHVYNVFDLSTPLSKRVLVMSVTFLKVMSVVTASFMFMGVGRAVHWSMGHLPYIPLKKNYLLFPSTHKLSVAPHEFHFYPS